jgi:uncharacterized membrane protein
MTVVLGILAITVLLVFIIWFVSGPLRHPASAAPTQNSQQRALEAARDAKYAEIRDTELDYRTGKLSEEDFRTFDRQLRAEAVEILRSLDKLR